MKANGQGNMQSVHLQKMMQKHKLYPEYDLALPVVHIKKKSLKKLGKGDVLLLGLDCLNMVLIKEGAVCAKVSAKSVGETLKIEIVSLEEPSVNMTDSKKYENIVCIFTKLQCRLLEVGHKVEISTGDITEVELFAGSEKKALGSLVNVDDEMAIEITEVYHG